MALPRADQIDANGMCFGFRPRFVAFIVAAYYALPIHQPPVVRPTLGTRPRGLSHGTAFRRSNY